MSEASSTTATMEQPTTAAPPVTTEQTAPSREDAAAAAVLAARDDRGNVQSDKLTEAREKLKATIVSPPQNPEARRDENGRFKESEKKAEAKDDAKPENSDRSKSDTAARKAREDDALARHALKRDGFTDQEIDEMPQASRVLVGLKAKAKQDALAREHAAKAKPNQSGPRPVDADEDRGEGQGRAPKVEPSALLSATTPEPEPDGPSTEGLERVLGALDDDAKEILRQAIEDDRSKTAKQLRDLEKQSQKARQEIFEARLLNAQSTLVREYPALAEDARAAEVGKFMRKLEPHRDLKDLGLNEIRELLSTACAAVFGREAIQAARDRHIQNLSDDLAGQPFIGGTKGSDTPRQVSREDIAARAVLKHPSDLDAARREMNRALGV